MIFFNLLFSHIPLFLISYLKVLNCAEFVSVLCFYLPVTKFGHVFNVLTVVLAILIFKINFVII